MVPVVADRALGWVQDPVDDRDQDAVQLLSRAGPVPEAASNRDLVQIVDQGRLGSCTANAVGQAIRAAEIVQWVEQSIEEGINAIEALRKAQSNIEFMSRLFAYFLARSWQGLQNEDTGTFIRLVFTSLNKYGFCPESAWSYDDNPNPGAKFSKMPSAEAFRQAHDQRDNVANREENLISYSRITSTGYGRVDAIKQAITQRHLVAFGTLVTNKFCQDMSANDGEYIDPPADFRGPDIAGGHAMCVAGYTPKGALIANSWSEDFGIDGFCYFTWDYITWASSTDFWIVKRAPMYQEAA